MGLATYLLHALDERNLSAAKFAKKVGMSNASVSNILRNDDLVPKLETLVLFANTLEVPLAHLIRACGYETGEELPLCDEALLAALDGHWRHRYYIAMMLLLPPHELEDHIGDLSSLDVDFANKGGASETLVAATDHLMRPVWNISHTPPIPPLPEPDYPRAWNRMSREERGAFLVQYLRKKVAESVEVTQADQGGTTKIAAKK